MTDSFFYDVIYIPATQCQSCNKTFDKTTKNDQKQANMSSDLVSGKLGRLKAITKF